MPATFAQGPEGRMMLDSRPTDAGYRELADAIPHLVWTMTPNGKPDFLNARWYQHTGLSADASLGQAWIGSVHADDRLLAEQRWLRALETGQPFEVECRLHRTDGDCRWFLCRSLPQRDEAGRI